MKELLLLRHGKSNWNTLTSDFDRPLKKRGKHNARKMGNWLAEQQLRPDLIISSPAQRALSTAVQIGKTMGFPTQLIQSDQRIYEAEPVNLLQVITATSNSIQRLLLVGHNLGMEELLTYFIPNIPLPDDGKLLPTATLAFLQFDQQWDSLSGYPPFHYRI